MEDVRKPALMRALFRLGCAYSGQELSYTKILGQLQDRGNTITVAHCLDLLGKAGMLSALPKCFRIRKWQNAVAPLDLWCITRSS